MKNSLLLVTIVVAICAFVLGFLFGSSVAPRYQFMHVAGDGLLKCDVVHGSCLYYQMKP